VQATVINITDKHAEYAKKVEEILNNQGIRAASDLRNEKIGLKIRELSMQRVPYQLVVGDREMEQNTVAVRTRTGKDLGTMPTEAFAEKLSEEIVSRGRIILED